MIQKLQHQSMELEELVTPVEIYNREEALFKGKNWNPLQLMVYKQIMRPTLNYLG